MQKLKQTTAPLRAIYPYSLLSQVQDEQTDLLPVCPLMLLVYPCSVGVAPANMTC